MNCDLEPQTPAARLTKVEKAWLSPVEELTGEDVPYWVIGRRAAGWMQRVVDHFRGAILFVQAGTGEGGEIHLAGVLHLRGPADTRVLARLIYHAHGVAAPDALLEPFAAAVETRHGLPVARPLVIGVGTSRKMIAQITAHLEQNPAGRLTPRQAAIAVEVRKQGDKCGWKAVTMERWLMRRHADRFLKAISAYPGDKNWGRGIVICAGGPRYFTCAWVCVKMLRRLGCTLPVEFWHLGEAEMTPEMEALVAPLGVKCVDAHEVRQQHPARTLGGWELKCYAILHSRFKDVLLLDADNVPVKNPEFLFDTPQYAETGAIFWPDCNRLGPEREIWRICGVRHRDEWEFESGQIVVAKERCWQALQLAMHYNEHSDFYYQHIYGDKETFHLAFRRTGKDYAMPEPSRRTVQGTICQDDFGGKLLFQHRIKKWNIAERDKPTVGFRFDAECRGFLEELHQLWTWRSHRARLLNAADETPAPRTSTAELLKHRGLLEGACAVEFSDPQERFAGRGIVICGGGAKYFLCVYVLVRLLRHLGCALPIEVWHLGRREMSREMQRLLEEHGAVCVDAHAVRRVHPARRLGGWELKCYAMMHSAFEEVLLLDADNCPVRDPAFLFDTPQYRRTGAIFWPDFTRFAPDHAVWAASGIEYRDEPEFESGQIVVDKARCWRALNVAMHLNEHSDWWYRLIHGDKDTFHLAWRKLGQDYSMPSRAVEAMDGVMLQFDFAGERLFQHRNFAKWTLEGNRRIAGFRLEKECLHFISELRGKWEPPLPPGTRRFRPEKAGVELRAVPDFLCGGKWRYERVGLDARALVFLPDGTVGEGAAACERVWTVRKMTNEGMANDKKARWELQVFGEHGLTLRARLEGDGVWRGAWVVFERGPVELRRVAEGVQTGGETREVAGEWDSGRWMPVEAVSV